MHKLVSYFSQVLQVGLRVFVRLNIILTVVLVYVVVIEVHRVQRHRQPLSHPACPAAVHEAAVRPVTEGFIEAGEFYIFLNAFLRRAGVAYKHAQLFREHKLYRGGRDVHSGPDRFPFLLPEIIDLGYAVEVGVGKRHPGLLENSGGLRRHGRGGPAARNQQRKKQNEPYCFHVFPGPRADIVYIWYIFSFALAISLQ